ncbi:MAG TPA: HD domain-containing phosphohydrolase [Vicinamibacterales bacterium]
MSEKVLRVYVATVVAAGVAVLAIALASLRHAPHPLEWALFALLALVTGSFSVAFVSVAASITVSDTFVIASALLFGPAPATLALALDCIILSRRRKLGWTRLAFNAAGPPLSLWCAAKVFFFVADVPPLALSNEPLWHLLLPLLLLIGVYFILNSGLTAIAVGLEAKQSPVDVWWRHFLWLGQGYFASGSVALCLILVVRQAGPLAVTVILPVLAIYHRTLGASFGRLSDARGHLQKLDRLYQSTVETLAMAIDAKDDVTHSHVRRVQTYALALARELGIGDEQSLKAIEAAALLHDTGKLAVPEHILNKPGGLTTAEFEQMKRHVDVGADILSLVDFPFPVVPIVRAHHESWNGSGYPRGLSGEEIPIGARILSVVDCFDALTSDRPYRKRLTDEAALDILRERRGTMYDPRIVDTFIATYRSVKIDITETPQQREVLSQIRATPVDVPAAQAPAGAAPHTGRASGSPAASDDVLAFVSLARLATGDVTQSDILALATNLVRRIVPSATGAWFLKNEAGDRLVAVSTFGPAADAVRGVAIRVGDRLTGWVAVNRQTIVNSDAALDLADRALRATPPLVCCLSVPLASGGAVGGVLSLYASERGAFSEDAGRLLEMVAPQIAEALVAVDQKGAAARTGADLRLVSSR